MKFLKKSKVLNISKKIIDCQVALTGILPHTGCQMYWTKIKYNFVWNNRHEDIRTREKSFFGKDLNDLKNQINNYFLKQTRNSEITLI